MAISVPVTDALIKELCKGLDDTDKRTIKQLTGKAPLEAIRDSVANADVTEAWLVDGEVAAICGIRRVTFLSDWAWPWFACNSIARQHPVECLRKGRIWVRQNLEKYQRLSSMIGVEDKRAIRWTKALGFKLYPPAPFGPEGALFMKSELKYGS